MQTKSVTQVVVLGLLAAMTLPGRVLPGETHYVAASGDDANTGAKNSPWANLSYAITVAVAGDTILMREGTYITDEVWVRGDRGMGGAEGKYLTIKSYPGETASIGGDRNFIVEADYVRIEGLHIRMPYNIAGGGEGFQVVNNVFDGQQPGYGAIQYSGNNGLIEGNRIVISGDGDTRDHGIYLFSGHDIIIRNNLISGMAGYGLHVYDENQLTGHANILVEGNVILNSQSRAGIIVSPVDSTFAEGIIIRKNIIANNAINGIRLRGDAHDIQIYNNTIYGNGWGAGNPDDVSAISAREVAVHDVVIKNNLIHVPNAIGYHLQNRQASSGITVERNLYWGTGAPLLFGVSDSAAISADPWLADPANNDFHLASLSAAIDAGLDLGLPFSGNAADLGAMEFGIDGIAASPSSQDFGKVEAGLNSEKTINVSNSGTGSVEITKAAVLGANADEFSVVNGSEVITLPPGTNHDFNLKFTPLNTGNKQAVLRLTFSGTTQDTALCISLTGYGDPGNVPDMALSATAYTFNELELGLSDSTVIAISNVGKTNLEVSLMSITGLDSTQFSVDSLAAPFVVAPGDSHDLAIGFTPTSVGTKTATLHLQSNDWDSPLLTISLTGTAIAAKVPDISVNSMSHDFGNADVGTSLSYSVQVQNAGTKDLVCTSTRILGTDSTEFSIQQGGAPFTLIPAAIRNLTISFHPTRTGIKTCVLRLVSNDPTELNLNVSLIGNGTPATGVDENNDERPAEFLLKQNYPNPFNPETAIEYEVPTVSRIRIRIYDLTGGEVGELVNEEKTPGAYRVIWNGKNALGSSVASGTYFYKIEASAKDGETISFSQSRRMIVLR